MRRRQFLSIGKRSLSKKRHIGNVVHLRLPELVRHLRDNPAGGG